MIIIIVSAAVLNGHNFGIFRGGGEVIVLIVLIVVVFALNLLFFRSPCLGFALSLSDRGVALFQITVVVVKSTFLPTFALVAAAHFPQSWNCQHERLQ